MCTVSLGRDVRDGFRDLEKQYPHSEWNLNFVLLDGLSRQGLPNRPRAVPADR